MAQQLSQALIEEWIALANGTFNVRDIWSEIGIESEEGKKHLRVILGRLVDKGILTRTSRDGTYRKLDNELKPMDWQAADPMNIMPIQFPFEIEEYCKIYPRSIVIVAGSKQAGKTAFLYNLVQMNMDRFQVDLFNNETGLEQMQERFAPLGIPDPAPFNTYERYDNFADVVDPDHLTVIDYLDLNSEVYLVGTEIDAIFRKLRTGVAVIGLQKPPPSAVFVKGEKKLIERDLAYGAGFTAKRACLYISMGSDKLKLVYVKTPANPRVNPNNMTWTFSINSNGIHFINVQRYYGDIL